MLHDKYFYPLAGLIIAVMVGIALSFGRVETLSVDDILRDGFTIEGEDLARMETQPGTLVEFIPVAGTEPAYARLSSNVARDIAPPGPGVFASIGADYEAAFAGRRLRLTITARSSRVRGLSGFDMAYFSAGAGDSGWKARPLTGDWAEYVLEFTPGVSDAGERWDYFSIWPGTTADLEYMDVRKMRAEVLE